MGKGFINYDVDTTNLLLKTIKDHENLFPFDTSPMEGSSKGITSGAVVEALKDVSSKMKGYFLTEKNLKSIYATADEGSKAYVGYNYPYAIYLYESSKGGWYDTGQVGGDDLFNAGEFYTKIQIDEKIAELSDKADNLEKESVKNDSEKEQSVSTPSSFKICDREGRVLLKVDERGSSSTAYLVYKEGKLVGTINAEFFQKIITQENGNIYQEGDSLKICDREGRVLLKVDERGSSSTAYLVYKEGKLIGTINAEFFQKIITQENGNIYQEGDSLKICDREGRVFCIISPDGIRAINFLDKEGNSPFLSEAPSDSRIYGRKNKQWVPIEIVNGETKGFFTGKNLYTLCDSLGTAGVWQNRLCELTGMTFDNTLNTDKFYPISVGGTQTGIFEDGCGLQRSLNLVKLKEDHQIDVVFIENINDYTKASGSMAGDINDVPWMLHDKRFIDEDIYENPASVISFWNDNFNSIVSGIEQKLGTALMFRIGGSSTAYKISILSKATENGSLIIGVGGITFNVEVTKEMSVEDIVDKIVEWQYTSGWTDVKTSSSSVTWNYYTKNEDKKVTFNTSNTGISFRIETNNQSDSDAEYNSEIKSISLIAKCFVGNDLSKWNDSSFWKLSTEISLVSAYKGMLEFLKKELPNALIYWLLAPRYSIKRSGAEYIRPDGSFDILKFNEIEGNTFNKLIDIQKEVCALYNIPTVDVISKSNINLSNIFTFYPENNVHPLNTGYNRWGESISRQI